MSVTIRIATTQDDRDVASAFLAAQHPDASLEELRKANVSFAIAEDEGTLMGATSGLRPGLEGYNLQIYFTAVAPGYQGLGVSTRLCEKLIKESPGETFCAVVYVTDDESRHTAEQALQGDTIWNNGTVIFYASDKMRLGWV